MGQGRHRYARPVEGRCARSRHVELLSARPRLPQGASMGFPDISLAASPQGDAEVYDMLSRADSVGVFQVESRAQMSMLPRLKPAKFYDLVIEVAQIHPTGTDPGRHGASLAAPARRHREDAVSLACVPRKATADELENVLKQNPRRAALAGAGDADRHHGRRKPRPMRRTACDAPWRPFFQRHRSSPPRGNSSPA